MRATKINSQNKRIKIKSILILMPIFVFFAMSNAQNTKPKGDVYVDESGLMRWKINDNEVYGFGVNYTVPFAHAYRSAKRMGIDPKKAIEQDVYHFSRLGFDLFRIHVWDTEISDTLGNLLENEHLDAFDFLLKTLNDKGIRSIITPIAFWGNGWPEPDENTPGFSHKYGKDECLTNPDAIEAQHKYLFQFLNHINPYTGIAYKDDSNIIAFEVSNEPHHRGEAKEVTKFVKGMLKAMRKTGTKKPIFYNTSHAVHFAEAYFKAKISGGTFQWYPSGLGYQQELSGNMLPNVNEYKIPFDATIQKYHGAKIVYEFDAADIGKSYIYPAMARSFREAGIQLATHFAYDPTYLANSNTEYNTHYMNLAYAPQKALSLMIASKVFHHIPLYSDFGVYPNNNTFNDFIIDYINDLAIYNSAESFMHTNNTSTKPKDETSLKQIAGFGNSKLVNYDGKGAYFLDKLENGLWRLELMPDAIWVDNLFGRNSPQKTVAVIQWATHKMELMLANLGGEFNLTAINTGNSFTPEINGRTFSIRPGTYIITKSGNTNTWSPNDAWKNNALNAFYAPKPTVDKAWLKHKQISESSENTDIPIEVQYVAKEKPIAIQAIIFSGFQSKTLILEETEAYTYEVHIPAEMVKAGFISYTITVEESEGKYTTYPAEKEGKPFDWDFYERSSYQIRVVPSNYPIHLFDAKRESNLLVKQWRPTLKLKPTTDDGAAEYQINLEKIFIPNNENLNAIPIYDYSLKHFILNRIEGRETDLSLKEKLVFKGRALNNKNCKIQLAFVMDNGQAYGAILEITPEGGEYMLDLSDLKPVNTVTLPRPYPSFLPYYLKHNLKEDFDIKRIESIQLSIGPGIPMNELNDKHGLAIESLRLE